MRNVGQLCGKIDSPIRVILYWMLDAHTIDRGDSRA